MKRSKINVINAMMETFKKGKVPNNVIEFYEKNKDDAYKKMIDGVSAKNNR